MKTANILLGAIFCSLFTHELKPMTRYVVCTLAGFLGGRHLPFFHKKDRLDHIEMEALKRTNEYSNDDVIKYRTIKKEISYTAGEEFTSSDVFARMLACIQDKTNLPQINKCWDWEINYNKVWSNKNK